MTKPSWEFLSRKARQLEVVLDTLDDLVLVVDSRGKIVRASRAAERSEIGTPESIRGNTLETLFDYGPNEPSIIMNVWRQCKSLDFPEYALEDEGLDGRLGRTLLVRIRRNDDLLHTLNPDEPVAAPLVLATIRDVSELLRQRVQGERTAKFGALQLLQRSIAHELGNPIAALKVTNELLLEASSEGDTGRLKAYSERSSEVLARLEEVLRRMLKDDGLAEVKIQECSALSLLERARQLFSGRIRQRGVDFEVQLPSDDVRIWADPVAATEVLSNILQNALSAVKSGGISVSVKRSNDHFTVCILDTGPGIPPEMLESLLLPFNTSKADGLGLGLSYSAYLMKRMGGHLNIDSQPDRGTRVDCTFPVAR